MISKTDLRKSFRAQLDESWGGEAAAQAHEALNERLVTFLKNQSGLWAAFQPQGFEPDIRPAMSRLVSIDWVFPRVLGDHLEFYRASDEGCMVANRWGILEPDPARCEPIDAQTLSGLLIPGLAFDHHCNRLGRGRGFYDRLLSRFMPGSNGELLTSGRAPTSSPSTKANPTKIKIGIAHDRQISETELPVEGFDVPMDYVLTETRCFSRQADGPSSWPAPLAGPPSQRKTS